MTSLPWVVVSALYVHICIFYEPFQGLEPHEDPGWKLLQG